MLPETSKEFFFCDQLIVAEPMLRNDQNISATMIGGSGRSSTLDVCSQMYTHTHTHICWYLSHDHPLPARMLKSRYPHA